MFYYDPTVKEIAPFDEHGRGVVAPLTSTELQQLADNSYDRMKEIILGVTKDTGLGTPFEGFKKYEGELWSLVANFVLATEKL